MARQAFLWLACGVLVVAACLSSSAYAQDAAAPTLDEAIAAFDGVDTGASRLDVWRLLQTLDEATAVLPNHRPSREDPQQAVVEALAVEHLALLVSAYGKLESLRYYLRPLVELEMLRSGGPDLARLDTIRLIHDANEDQAWAYVRDIVRASQGQRRRSSSDPQVGMLRELGADHMAILLQTLEMPTLQYYASAAVREAAGEPHKELIIGALLHHEQLIGVVQRNGWAGDARDTIMLGLQQGVDYIPRMWVQALAELEDPQTYDTLALALLQARCSKHYYLMIKDLPGIALDDAVAASWELVHTSPTHSRELREVSQIAVAHGHLGALEHLVSLLPSGAAVSTSRSEQVRRCILTCIDFEGTDDEIRSWIEQHRGMLRFCPEAGVFYVSGGVD